MKRRGVWGIQGSLDLFEGFALLRGWLVQSSLEATLERTNNEKINRSHGIGRHVRSWLRS